MVGWFPNLCIIFHAGMMKAVFLSAQRVRGFTGVSKVVYATAGSISTPRSSGRNVLEKLTLKPSDRKMLGERVMLLKVLTV